MAIDPDIEQCEACAVEREGCHHHPAYGCFLCSPATHPRPPCHPLCPKRARRDAEEAVRKAHESSTYQHDTYPTARVREVNGQLVLEDPQAMAVVKAVEKHNCRSTLKMHYERVQHFTRRIAEKGLCVDDWVIVLLNVDDPYGGQLASILMPGHDWQAYRDRGEVPYARGLASREGLQEGLDTLDPEAATKLRETKGETAIIVMDFGVVEVFRAGAPRPAAVMGPDFGDPV